MLPELSDRETGVITLILLAALTVFHLLVLAGVAPPIVWGGNVTDHAAMITGELISLLMTMVFMAIVAIRSGIIWPGRFQRTTAAGIWCMAAVFLLSTVGNLTSGIAIERLIFTPLSIMLTVLALRLGIRRHSN